MTPRTRRAWTLTAALLAAAVALPLAADGVGRGQPTPAPAGDRPEEVQKLTKVGFVHCEACHREPSQGYREQKITDFIRLDEATTWRQHDLHTKAFMALKEPLGQQMGRLLGVDVTRDVSCLACHAVNLSQELTPGSPRPGRSTGDFYWNDGVSCEACHGVAEKWLAPHFDKSWRTVPPGEKLAKYGERDMRDPASRAERCAACHAGNAAEGKFVTHAMYAAGHPPLPPLEVMTFSRDQPKHYNDPRDLPYFASLDADTAWRLFHYRKGECSPARQVAIGAAVTFREAMRTLAHAAAARSDGRMLDFAHFDCAACHHELASPSWRPTRGYATTPGRPLPFTGPTALLRAVLRYASEAAPGADAPGSPVRSLKLLAGEFDVKLAALLKAFSARPFGDPAAVAPAARDLAAWSDAVAKGLDALPYGDAQSARLLRVIAAVAQHSAGLGYDDAQQLLWAFDVLRSECPGVRAKPEVTAELQKLTGPEPDKPFVLRLRPPDPPPTPVAETLPGRLRRAAAYQPESFRQAFGRIAAALKAGE
jgi:hypothetical protein